MKKRLLPIVAAAVLLAAGPAAGGNVAVGLALRSGGLSLRAPALAALPGRAVQVPLTLADARGTGAGWTLALNGPAAVTISSISVRCAAGSTCTLPKAGGGTGILHATRDSGMGVMQLVVTVAPLRQGSASVPLDFSVA